VFVLTGVVVPYVQYHIGKNGLKALKIELKAQKKRFADLEEMVWKNQGDFFCMQTNILNGHKDYAAGLTSILRALFCYLEAGYNDKLDNVFTMIDFIFKKETDILEVKVKAITPAVWTREPELRDAYNEACKKLEENKMYRKYLMTLKEYAKALDGPTVK
jgi:hypothetical protein